MKGKQLLLYDNVAQGSPRNCDVLPAWVAMHEQLAPGVKWRKVFSINLRV